MPKFPRRQRKRRARLSPYFIKRLSSWLVLSTAFTAGVATLTRAATLYWDATPASGVGATDGSGAWSAGAATFYNPLTGLDVAAGSGDTAVFGSGGVLSTGSTVNVTGAQNVGGLVFGATGLDGCTTNGYTLSSTSAVALTIGTGGVTMNAGAQSAILGNSADLTVTLGGAQTWTNNSSSSLTVAGNITNGANALALSSGANSAGNINITGNIVGGSGTVTVNSSGVGIVTLSGTDTETGVTTLTAGILRATSAGALGAGTLTLTSGTLQLVGGLAFNNNTTVGGTVTIQSDNAFTDLPAAVDTLGTLNLGAFTLTVTAGEFVASSGTGVTFGATTLTGAGTINTNNSLFGPNPFSSPSTAETALGVTTTLYTLSGAEPVVIGGAGNTTIGNTTTNTGLLPSAGSAPWKEGFSRSCRKNSCARSRAASSENASWPINAATGP